MAFRAILTGLSVGAAVALSLLIHEVPRGPIESPAARIVRVQADYRAFQDQWRAVMVSRSRPAADLARAERQIGTLSNSLVDHYNRIAKLRNFLSGLAPPAARLDLDAVTAEIERMQAALAEAVEGRDRLAVQRARWDEEYGRLQKRHLAVLQPVVDAYVDWIHDARARGADPAPEVLLRAAHLAYLAAKLGENGGAGE